MATRWVATRTQPIYPVLRGITTSKKEKM